MVHEWYFILLDKSIEYNSNTPINYFINQQRSKRLILNFDSKINIEIIYEGAIPIKKRITPSKSVKNPR